MLLRAFDGRLAGPDQPWVLKGVGYLNVWIDFAGIPGQIHWLSDRDRPVLLLAASLAESVPLVLGEVVAAPDRDNLELALAAIAHAGTNHISVGIWTKSASGGTGTLCRESLYPWPSAVADVEDHGS